MPGSISPLSIGQRRGSTETNTVAGPKPSAPFSFAKRVTTAFTLVRTAINNVKSKVTAMFAGKPKDVEAKPLASTQSSLSQFSGHARVLRGADAAPYLGLVKDAIQLSNAGTPKKEEAQVASPAQNPEKSGIEGQSSEQQGSLGIRTYKPTELQKAPNGRIFSGENPPSEQQRSLDIRTYKPTELQKTPNGRIFSEEDPPLEQQESVSIRTFKPTEVRKDENGRLVIS